MKHNFSRFLSILLCLAMLVGVLPMTVLAEEAEAPAEHSYVNGFCSDCEELEPAVLVGDCYQIGNAGQLYWFAKQVNAGNGDLCAIVTEDIVINADMTGEDLVQWVPIGSGEVPFQGTFDGNGKTISGIFFEDATASYVGLFGFVSNAVIENVAVVDSYICGGNYTGAIVGAGDYATISGCVADATVSGGSNVGGISGNSYMGVISGCTNSGDVTGGSYVGGILGTGVGYQVNRCGNSGDVSGNGSRVGGIVGNAGGEAEITNCYNIASVSGNDYVGGMAGNLSADAAVGSCYNTGVLTGNGSRLGIVAGALVDGETTVVQCFYLPGCAPAVEDVAGSLEAVEAAVFADGSLTYLLNGATHEGELVWFQELGVDGSPMLSGPVVYATAPCVSYTNDAEALVLEHVGDAATCTEEAVCDVCGQVYHGALGHNYYSESTAPTCTEEGFTVHTCVLCGDSYVDAVQEPLGHTFADATCTEAATCTVCGETEGEPLGHSFESVILQPTCTADGYGSYTCTVCEYHYEEVLPTPGHVWEEANCVAPKTCTVCGLTEGESSDHYYKSVVTDPTCTEAGFTTHTCTGCGDSYVDSYVEPTGHSWRVATCSAPKTCAICGKTEGEVLGHDYDKAVTAPTCTEAGFTTYTCTACGHSYVGNYTDALGHDYVVTVVEPTCTASGYTSYSCSVCAHGYDTSFTDPLGHDYQGGICTGCGDVRLEAPVIKSCYSKERTSVKVTWIPVANASGYELWRSATPDNYYSWKRVKTINDGSVDRYTNHDLEEGVTYYYGLRAFITLEDGSRVYSDYSNMSYMPAAVVFDQPYSNATFRVRLRWQEVGGSHGYQIWRKNADGSWSIVKTLGDKDNVLTNNQGSTTAYSNTGLVAGNTYTYRMRAFCITEDGRKVFGAYSEEYSVAVKPQTPEVTVVSNKEGRAELRWEAVNGAVGYQIWMSETPTGPFTIVKSITDGTTTSYTKRDLESGKTYYFRVRAYAEAQGVKSFSANTGNLEVLVK